MKQAELRQKFEEVFGAGGDIREYFSPGRVNLIGEHTDYNGGHVFPCALTLGTYGLARKREDGKIRFYSANMADRAPDVPDLSDLTYREEYGWANYPLGVVWALREQKGLILDRGFDLAVYGDIPNGSGLSSSASLEVLTGVVIRDLYGFEGLTNIDLALIGQYGENHFNGCNCGIMDQFAVAMGRKDAAIFLDCADLSYEYAPIRLADAKILISNSKVKHSLVESAYNDRRNECAEALRDLQSVLSVRSLGELDAATFEAHADRIKDPVCRRRARHAVCENQRTIRAVEALKEGRIEEFGRLMNASHISLRDDYEVSCPEVDILVEEAWKISGVIGSRITGGGFGGCTVSLVRNDAIDSFMEQVGSAYRQKTGIEADFYVVEIGDGAGRVG